MPNPQLDSHIDASRHVLNALNATVVNLSLYSDCGPISVSTQVRRQGEPSPQPPRTFSFRPEAPPYNPLNHIAAGSLQVPVVPSAQGGQTTIVVTFTYNAEVDTASPVAGHVLVTLYLFRQASDEPQTLTRELDPGKSTSFHIVIS